ncbi:tRNA adenosine deaminase-associated protein [Streptomyces varsoviensis]|nr:tRNA adenosine deaminase-associated protein [Streptomyces varsoviensis]
MYFAALLARTEDGWQASDTELDNVETLSDLADLARESAVDDDTVLVFIEQEDAWFAVVRVDGEDDPRVYLSDAAAATRSSYGAMLADELLGRNNEVDELDTLDLDGTEDGEPEAEEEVDAEAAEEPVPAGPLGEGEILADLGMPEQRLKGLSDDALGEIADMLGCAEVLEAVR